MAVYPLPSTSLRFRRASLTKQPSVLELPIPVESLAKSWSRIWRLWSLMSETGSVRTVNKQPLPVLQLTKIVLEVHTVGAPLAHVSREHVQPFWKKFSNIKSLKRPNVHFVQGSVENVDTQNMAARVRTTGSGANQKIPYHSFVAATGLQRAWPIVPNKHNFEGYVNDANALIENIGLAEDVMVIGGGKRL